MNTTLSYYMIIICRGYLCCWFLPQLGNLRRSLLLRRSQRRSLWEIVVSHIGISPFTTYTVILGCMPPNVYFFSRSTMLNLQQRYWRNLLVIFLVTPCYHFCFPWLLPYPCQRCSVLEHAITQRSLGPSLGPFSAILPRQLHTSSCNIPLVSRLPQPRILLCAHLWTLVCLHPWGESLSCYWFWTFSGLGNPQRSFTTYCSCNHIFCKRISKSQP